MEKTAEKISKLMREGDHDRATKMWEDSTKDLKRFEAVALKNRIHELLGH